MRFFRRTFFLFLVALTWRPFLSAANVDVSTATGNRIEFDNLSHTAIIEGNAQVFTSTANLKADKITVNTQTKHGVAEGNAHVLSSTANLTADKITMDNDTSIGHAIGNVTIKETSSTVTGTEAFYNWQTSTGAMKNAHGISPPWRFSADQMIMRGRGIYELEEGDLTSCDAVPPHFLFHSRRSNVVTGKRATLRKTSLVLGETPVFWMPFYTRSLVPKKYTLRVEPGASGRDGLILKTTLGIPLMLNTYTKFKWDYYQNTGNGWGIEHQYNLPAIKGVFDTYYIYDDNPDEEPESRRFRVNWNHFQKFTSRFSGHAKLNFQSDQSFGKNFSGSDQGLVENSVRGVLSEAGFSYQFKKSSLDLLVERRDRFDSQVSSKSFVSKVTLPRITWNTIPMSFKNFPFLTSFASSYSNETVDRSSPTVNLEYRRTATTGVQIKKDLSFNKSWKLTPRLGMNESWQDHDFNKPNSETDIYVGRYTTGLDVRRRITRAVDLTLGYTYIARTQPNKLNVDVESDDHGVETNIANGLVNARVGRTTRLSLSSGYNFRDAPKSNPTLYKHDSARVVPPSLDIQWEAKKNVNVFFRETYSIYDSAVQRPVNTPLLTSAEVQVGNPASRAYFSQGMSYSKTPPGEDAVLNLSNKLKFYLSPKWYLDILIGYRAVGPSGIDYRKILPTEKSITVVRDLHCWVFRMEFTSRPDRKEASFYIDLKTNLNKSRNLFDRNQTHDFTAFPDRQEDVGDIFPGTPPPVTETTGETQP
jgi:LptA/(LptD N-terminal domain) LPS transport protein